MIKDYMGTNNKEEQKELRKTSGGMRTKRVSSPYIETRPYSVLEKGCRMIMTVMIISLSIPLQFYYFVIFLLFTSSIFAFISMSLNISWCGRPSAAAPNTLTQRRSVVLLFPSIRCLWPVLLGT